jgi:hypothetical protein
MWLSFHKLAHNVPLTDDSRGFGTEFFLFRKNENRKIKSQITENQRLRLSAVTASFTL